MSAIPLEHGAVPMSRSQRVGNLLGVGIPAAGLVAAVVLLWSEGLVGPAALAIAAVMYVLTGIGVTVGFHRLLAHRSFETSPAMRALMAVLGSMALEGPVTKWVANHRMHHAFTDEHGDPHSPHVDRSPGLTGVLAGLWHAHVGWMITGAAGRASPERYARDLLAERSMRVIDRTFGIWAVLGLALPFAAGLAIAGTLEGGLLAMLWGGPVRIFALHHATFAINSLCHVVGRRRFATSDESRNVAWLAPWTLGEAWHNNHHAFPTSAFHGLRRRDVDPGGWVIRALERAGLAWNVRRVSADSQRAKSLAPGVCELRIGDGARAGGAGR